MQLPVIHMNGTSAEELLAGYQKAARAVELASRALCDASPNGRDYYPAAPQALEVAVQEHYARLAKLREVATELDALMEHCSDAVMARKAR